MLTPRERVEAALFGRLADRVPFTMDFNEFFLCTVERELRNAGMCAVEQRVPVYRERNPAVSVQTVEYAGSDGFMRRRKMVRTEKGEISALYKIPPDHPRIPGEFMPWDEEHFFKGPEDYAPIEAMIRGRQYVANYDAYRRAEEEAGSDVIFRSGLGYSPLQEIIYTIMGLEHFAVEWHDRRDEVMRLYTALIDDKRKIYPIAVESPAAIISYCGNISPEVVGVQRFQQYILPHLDELGEMLHTRGKLLLVHYDANTRLLAPAIAGSQCDVIDSITPYPNGDMSVAEARAAWPDKTLWLNFPGWTYHREPSVIEEATRQILREAGRGDHIIVGISENVPKDRWQVAAQVILRVLNAEGRLPLC